MAATVASAVKSPTAKIAFDARYINDRYHGIGRHAFGLLEALTRLDGERKFVVYYNPTYRNRRFDLGTLARRPNVLLRPVGLRLFSPIEQFAWPVTLARDEVSVFHSPYINVPILARVRLVPTVHDLIFERYPEYMPRRIFRSLYRGQMELAVRRAALVLTVSDATRRDLGRFYPAARGKTVVIGNAVDQQFTRVTDAERLAMVRRRYQLPERYVLALGAARPHKNLTALVDAFAQLGSGPRERSPAHLVLAGDIDNRFDDTVGRRIAAYRLHERVQRIAWVSEGDLPAIYSLAEVFVLPSLVEGFGLPVLEAMACGTPVVASNDSAVREVAGDAALSFDPLDVHGLAEQLGRILADAGLQADLARRGPVRARLFTWDGVAQAVLSAYQSVLPAG